MAMREAPAATVGGRDIWLAGIAGTIVAAVLNALVAFAALALGVNREQDFQALNGPGPAMTFTVIGLLAATFVFWLIAQRAARPLETFRKVAVVVLLISFLPDLLLLTQPGAGVADVLTLMLMHVVAFAVILAAFSRAAAR
jgi:hypothetical protein